MQKRLFKKTILSLLMTTIFATTAMANMSAANFKAVEEDFFANSPIKVECNVQDYLVRTWPEPTGSKNISNSIYILKSEETHHFDVTVETEKSGTKAAVQVGGIGGNAQVVAGSVTVDGEKVSEVNENGITVIPIDPTKRLTNLTMDIKLNLTNTESDEILVFNLESDCINPENNMTGVWLGFVLDDESMQTLKTGELAPTCTEKGYIKYTSENEDMFRPINATGHKWGEYKIVKNDDGLVVEERTCENCGEKETKDHVHNFVEKKVDATCTEEGYIEKECACGTVERSIIAPKGHTWNEKWTVVKEATENEEGLEENECTVCHEKRTRKIAKLTHQHNYKDEVVAPTCVTQGYTKHVCSCGHAYVDTYVVANDHKWSDWTPNEDGTKETRECSVCHIKDTRTIEEHEYTDDTVPPTCTSQGLTMHICKKCGHAYVDSYVAATGHQWGKWEVTEEASEDKMGKEVRKCEAEHCGAIQTRDIEKTAHVHKYEEKVIAPTCEEKGYTIHECSCGDSYKDNYTNALGHKWSEWEVTKEATESEKGEKTRTCSICQKTETKEIPVKEHEHKYEDTIVPPTCTEKGYTLHKCSVCGHEEKDTFVDMVPHTWGDWKVTKEATEKEDGMKERECSVCHQKETEVVKYVHEHKYEDKVVKPTCTEKGYTLHTCKCGDSYKDEYKDALGHDWGDWVEKEAATEEHDGVKERKCKTCGEKETAKFKLGDDINKDPKLGFEGTSEIILWSAIATVSVCAIGAVVYMTFKKKEN